MKTRFTFGFALAACAALTLSCEMAETPNPSDSMRSEAQGNTYTMTASTPDEASRTTMDGFNVNWASGDGLTVWHALAGGSSYIKDKKFSTASSGHSADFTGELNGALDPASNYDWYIIYPWKAKLVSPVGDISSWVGTHNVGIKSQDQAGLNNKTHLAGDENLLYYVGENVAGTGVPTAFTMNNLASAIKVKVTNNSGAPLRVHTIIVNGPDGETIAGQHAINLTTNPPTLTPNPSSASGRIRLNVIDAEAIAAGANAEFFMSCKPFTAGIGDEIKVNVNGFEHVYTMTAAKSFQSGMIKTINFNYNRADDDYSGTYIIYGNGTGSNTGKVYAIEALDYAANVNPGGGNNHVLYAYPIRVDGSTIYYHDVMNVYDGESGDPDIDNYKFTFTKVDAGEYTGMYTITNEAGNFLSTVSSSANDVRFQAEADVNSYWDVTPDGDGWQIVATKSANHRFLQLNFLDAAYPRSTALLATDEQTPVRMFNVADYTLTLDPVPVVKVLKTLSLGSEGASDVADDSLVEFLNNGEGWTPSIDSFTGCITAASIVGTTITYSAGTNSGKSPVAGTIVVKLTSGDGTKSTTGTITVSQRGVAYYVKVTSNLADFSGHYLIVNETAGVMFNGSLTAAALETNNTVAVSITDSKVLSTDAIDAKSWTITKGDSKTAFWSGANATKPNDYPYSIRAASGYYVGVFALTKYPGLNWNTDNKFIHNITVTAGDAEVTSCHPTKAEPEAWMRYHAGKTAFLILGTYGNQKPIQLYKLEEE